MPKLIIDDIAVEVPEGTNVLEAARNIGITIPHFCWHPALGKAGACRLCAVKLLDGPVKGLQMSCMLQAQDGMVVSTSDEEAVAMRRNVIEWLMINHPHDCPVCDEGGECQLQDFTIAGGHGLRRYDGRKRTHVNQFLGSGIEHEMNRCIQCYRCVRYYQDYAGGTDFGVTGRAGNVYFGRQQDGRLESPFSGNLVDICPTGVFTDKTARYRARYWDYDMAPSICPSCSLGCNTVPMARYRELLKVTARRNDSVNGWFICDKGRFSNGIVNSIDRPRQALIGGKPVTLEHALEMFAERVKEILARYGPGALAIVGSPRMSHEGNVMAARLRDSLGDGPLCYFIDANQAHYASDVTALLTSDNTASQADVRNADLVVIMECDLLDEAPMMVLAIRQAWRNGARVYIVGTMVPETASQHGYFCAKTAANLLDIPLFDAKRAVIICGQGRNGIGAIRAVAVSPFIKLAFIQKGPNAFGCSFLAQENASIPFSQAISKGQVKCVISFESDIPESLLDGIDFVGTVDWQRNGVTCRADIILPSASWIEMDGTFVNNEGRAQRFKKVMSPGMPIKGLSPERHPPRRHRNDQPGGDVLPAWQLIMKLMQRMGFAVHEKPFSGTWAPLINIDPKGEGGFLRNSI